MDSVNIVIKLNGSVQDITDSVSRYNYQASNAYICLAVANNLTDLTNCA